METIIDRLLRHAASDPDRCLYTFCNGEGVETARYTYRGFEDRTRALAEQIVAGYGIRRAQRVLLAYPPGLEPIAALVACVRAGVLPVPVCPPSPLGFEPGLRRIERIAADCDAGVVLTTGELSGSRPVVRGGSSSLTWLTTDGPKASASAAYRDDPGPLVLLQYTSGSTRSPRGVMVSHDNVLHNCAATLDFVPTCVSWLPQYHDMGLIGYYLFPMIVGGTTHGLAPVDFLRKPVLWLRRITEVRATHTGAPNFGYAYCLRPDKLPDAALGGVDLRSLRVMMNAAEPVKPKTQADFIARFSPYGLPKDALIAAYGLAENTITVAQHGRASVHVNTKLLQEGILHIEQPQAGGRNQIAIASCGPAVEGAEVAIVSAGSDRELGEDRIGEIWTAGQSTACGYWNRPVESAEVFGATLAPVEANGRRFLRTGDLGFLHEGELYLCGRVKDLIIVRGANYYPQDIEAIVEAASPKIRPGAVVAIEAGVYGGELVVLIEPRRPNDLPDPVAIVSAIRRHYHVQPDAVVFVSHGTLPRTTSGKLARGLARQAWREGGLKTIATYTGARPCAEAPHSPGRARLRRVLDLYGLTGDEELTLSELGIDSLTMVEILAAIQGVLSERGILPGVDDLDATILRRLTVASLVSLVDRIEIEDRRSLAEIRAWISRWSDAQARDDRASMRADRDRPMPRGLPGAPMRGADAPPAILMTGATGFFGPFLLLSLLERSSWTIHTLVRADGPVQGAQRLRAALARAGAAASTVTEIGRRVQIVCGDLARPALGLSPEDWRALAAGTQAIVHNGALVDYMLAYEALRPHNVEGTRDLLRLAGDTRPKRFHHVSSTFVFGWSRQALLLESDDNEAMEHLDFGYAQSKWVAEQMVHAAIRDGLDARIYRPSLISAASNGAGSADDIATRLLAFMITHGVAPEARNQVSFLPADLAADSLARLIAEPALPARAYHLTVDRYYSMIDVAREITRAYGYPFAYRPIPEFVAEMRRRATKRDPVFPLVPFFQRSQEKIAAMQHKRYDNRAYQEARRATGGAEDPALSLTVTYLMTFLSRAGLIPERPADAPSGAERESGVERRVPGNRQRDERRRSRAAESGVDPVGGPVGT